MSLTVRVFVVVAILSLGVASSPSYHDFFSLDDDHDDSDSSQESEETGDTEFVYISDDTNSIYTDSPEDEDESIFNDFDDSEEDGLVARSSLHSARGTVTVHNCQQVRHDPEDVGTLLNLDPSKSYDVYPSTIQKIECKDVGPGKHPSTWSKEVILCPKPMRSCQTVTKHVHVFVRERGSQCWVSTKLLKVAVGCACNQKD